MSKPTPRPWQVTPDQIRIQTGEFVDDYQVANCEEGPYAPPIDVCHANAAHIVKCVNMFDDLVKQIDHLQGEAQSQFVLVRALCEAIRQEIILSCGEIALEPGHAHSRSCARCRHLVDLLAKAKE